VASDKIGLDRVPFLDIYAHRINEITVLVLLEKSNESSFVPINPGTMYACFTLYFFRIVSRMLFLR